MTTIEGDVGNSISSGTINGTVQQIFNNYVRDALAAMALDQAAVRRLCGIHVEPPEFSFARSVLTERSSVALTGPPGCGRRTTGVALLAGLGVTLHSIVLDLEDLDRPPEVFPGQGYLVDLDEDHDRLTVRAGSWLQDLAVRLRAMGSYLVVRARAQSWKSLELDEHALQAIPLTAPAAMDVFRSHLASSNPDFVVSAWTRRDQIIDLLAGARPPEAVRLARIVCGVRIRTVPDSLQLDEVLAEYHNWEDELADWFAKTAPPDKGYERALMLAIAALHDAPAPTIFAAADQLSKLVGLPRIPGWPLAGEDITTLVGSTTAELHEGAVHFPRPAYAESVLDYVWRERPHLNGVLRGWLTGIPDASDEDSERAAGSLTELAIRQGEANLVCTAAAHWVKTSPRLRELGVNALTAAAVSDPIGQRVRRQLYDWATRANTSEEVHLAVADVCRGPLARAYPQIALTRLRHLAIRQSPNVQDAAREALASLSRIPALRHAVLAEVTAWVDGHEPRQSAGRRAFLRLARLDEAGEIPILSTTEQDLNLLASLWRDALRQHDPAGAAADTAADWLDAAAGGRAPLETVIEILARTCQTGIDLANLMGVVVGWKRADHEPADGSRRDIASRLALRAYELVPDAVPGARLGRESS